MNKYPAKPMMDQMAQYGRYGDSMLVHMNPIEVAGIASLSPTGSLTINPVTGQPEAFLPFLAPALGALGGALGLSTLGTAALTGIGTAAVTGDLKRGLISGLTAGVASGLGEGIGGLFDGASDAAQVATATTDATAGATDFVAEAAAAGQQAAEAVGGLPPVDYVASAQDMGATVDALGAAQPFTSPLPGQLGEIDTAIGQSRIGQGVQNVVDKMGTTGQLMGVGIGSGQLAQMDMMEDFEAQQRALMEEAEASKGQSYADLQSAYAMAQPGVARGFSPYRSQMSQRTYNYAAPGMAEGGIVRMDRGGVVPALSARQIYEALVNIGSVSADTPFEDWYAATYDKTVAPDAPGADPETTTQVTDKFEVLDEQGRDILAPGYYGMLQGQDQEDTVEYKAFQKAQAGEILTPYEQSQLERYYDRRERYRAERERAISGSDTGQTNELARYLQGSGLFGYTTGNIGGIDPVSIQAGLREDYKIAPPTDYMTGFEPEFQYFQADPNAPFIPSRAFRPTLEGVDSQGQYFDPILNRNEYLSQLQDYYRTLASYGMGGAQAPQEPVDEEPPAGDDGTAPATPGDGGAGAGGAGAGGAGAGTDTTPPSGAGSTDTVGGTGGAGGSYTPSSGGGGGPMPLVGSGKPGGAGTGGSYYRIEDGKIVAYQLESIYGVDPSVYANQDLKDSPVSGYFVAGKTTLGSVDDDPFIIPGSKGMYGEGVYYKDGALYSFISPEKLAQKRKAQEGNALKTGLLGGVDPDLMTEDEKLGYARLTGKLPSPVTGMSDWNAGSGDNPDTYIQQSDLDKYAERLSFGDFSGQAAEKKSEKTLAGIGELAAPEEEISAAVSTVVETKETPEALPEIDLGMGMIQRERRAPSVPTPSPRRMTPDALASIPQGMASGITGIPSINIDPASIQAAMAAAETPAPTVPELPADMPRITPESAAQAMEAIRASGFGGLENIRLPFQEGGRTLVSSIGEAQTPAGGIAEVDSAFAGTPSEQDVAMLASALLGEAQQADQIIQMFLDKYGPEVFGQVREMILNMVTPDAQNEGMIRGQGGGMDDMIPGMIGASQPVAVSPGEYIIPADVVSDLGDGSSDAGAEELDMMLERVRMARGGTAEQPPPIDAKRVMPG